MLAIANQQNDTRSSRLLKEISMQRLIKGACAIAAEDIGKERAARIAQNAQKRYEALRAENAGDPKALKTHK